MTISGETIGRVEARRLVKQVAKEHGYLGEDVLGKLDQETRRLVEEALLKKDLMIGSSVITLAQNLYTSSERFVFEMLQNADDNHYSKARASGATPYVSFHVHHRRIEVECNEDGFEPQNLQAICNIGKSTKTGAQGYIGEKGIGFKSVFMPAWKVHIQSGDFSFYFRHRQGDSGMGMISPEWQEPEQDLDSALTRITLFLHDAEDPEAIASQRKMISEQFDKLQDTVLLFLKNIEHISVMFYDEEENMTSSVTYSISPPDGENRVALERTFIENGRPEPCKRYYHVVKHVAENLAKSENRTYTPKEDITKAYAKAEVILAFEVTEKLAPIIKPQEVFAFLPVRRMGFTFLIQSDFVTQANRQDIVTTSVRNLGLLDGIADAFVKAVLQFCKLRHCFLQYQWMRYLPNEDSYPWDSFWKILISKIKDRLTRIPVLRPRSEGSLRLIKNLRRCTPNMLDRSDQPLFADIEPEIYLSSKYEAKDIDTLKPLGLFDVEMAEFLKRVRSDLRSPMSRMQSPRTDDDWHSRVAQILSLPFSEKWNNCIAELKAMNLLPLQDQRWVSANNGPVYFAESDGIPIPMDLNLYLLDPISAKNAHREALFKYLGVQYATSSYVRGLILKKYEKSIDPDEIDLYTSRRHLQYLYLTHNPQEYEPSQLRNIEVYCQNGTLGMPHQEDFYVSNNEAFGARELLKKTNPGREPGAGAPGLQVLFIHQEYFQDTPIVPVGHKLRWREWLHNCVKIRRHIRLTSTESATKRTVLSDVCQYLANHRQERFLGVLQYYWKSEGKIIEENRSIVDKLRGTKVLCKNNRMVTLSDAYLPIPSLESCCARILNDTRCFPFLLLEASLSGESYPVEWEFLNSTFGVGLHCDLDFYLAILASILDTNDSAGTLGQSSRVFNLYETIQAQCLESENRGSQQGKVRDFFDSKDCIIIPAYGTREVTWADRSECLWVAPPFLETKYPLESLYEDYFERSETDKMTLTQFFKTTLEISNANCRHIVDEIKHLNDSNCTDFDRINSLYICLDQMRSSGIGDKEAELKLAFEENALIYVFVNGQHGWHRASECLWASTTAIRGKTTLSDHFEDLKDFFVAFLGVEELNFAMVLDKLVEITAEASVAEVKDTLWVFNSLLLGQNILPPPKQILESHIFPVRYPNGQVELGTSGTDFAIVDRQHFRDAFADQAKLLDFGLDEVRRLKPFFQWAGLEYRYLSSMVKEISLLQGGHATPISTQDRDISRKAQGLFRIAMHYDSSRTLHGDQSLYYLLRNACVYETDGISSQLLLSQDGRELTTEVARSELHIHEDDSGLEIYVPRDLGSQDFCFRSKLPPRLLDWMMTQHASQTRQNVEPAAVLVATNVINANQSTVDLILEAAGIIEVDIPECDSEEDEETPAAHCPGSISPQSFNEQASPPILTPESASDTETPRLRLATSSLAVDSGSQANRPVIEQQTIDVNSEARFARSILPRQPTYTFSNLQLNAMPMHGPSSPAPNLDKDGIDMDEDANYGRILARIVTAARRSVIPTSGPFNMSALLNVLSDIDDSSNDFVDGSHRLRAASKIERDKKIGAAGELFVLELLSRLTPKLPNFSRDNWESTIRKYVKLHPEYADMDAWSGRETSDIVYDDTDSVLTEHFIDKGYLAQDQWRGLKPKYFIEVKSTTGACDLPFYMSKYQYQRMKDTSNGASGSTNPGCIYVVFRVFNLYKDSVGVRVYMDPYAMKQRGDLIFTEENWSVAPASSLN